LKLHMKKMLFAAMAMLACSRCRMKATSLIIGYVLAAALYRYVGVRWEMAVVGLISGTLMLVLMERKPAGQQRSEGDLRRAEAPPSEHLRAPRAAEYRL